MGRWPGGGRGSRRRSSGPSTSVGPTHSTPNQRLTSTGHPPPPPSTRAPHERGRTLVATPPSRSVWPVGPEGLGDHGAMAVWQETAGGGFRAGTAALPGLQRVRALTASDAVRPPLFRLTGMRVVQAGPGAATCSLPTSTLLLDPLQWVDLIMLTEATATMAGRAGVEPHRDVRCAAVSIHHQRVALIDAERLIARATTVHAGRTYSLVEVAVEDAVGRPLTRAMASLVGIDAVDAEDLEGSEPAFRTPDPWQREWPLRPVPETLAAYEDRTPADARLESLLAPVHAQLGLRVVENATGRHTTS